MKVEIYTGPFCGYCERAKSLLEQHGISYIAHDISTDAASRQDLLRRVPNARSVPQIFIDDTHIGGCEDLEILARDGHLVAAD